LELFSQIILWIYFSEPPVTFITFINEEIEEPISFCCDNLDSVNQIMDNFQTQKICYDVDNPDLVTWKWRIYGGAVVKSNRSKISGILTMDKIKNLLPIFP